MKTKLPDEINSVEEAKAFLTELCENGEDFHPDDDAHYIHWRTPNTPSYADCDGLNYLMTNILTRFSEFDAYGFIMEFGNPAPLVDINKKETNIKTVYSDYTGGNIHNDVITLKCGIVIRISEGIVKVFNDHKDDDRGLAAAEVLFQTPFKKLDTDSYILRDNSIEDDSEAMIGDPTEMTEKQATQKNRVLFLEKSPNRWIKL